MKTVDDMLKIIDLRNEISHISNSYEDHFRSFSEKAKHFGYELANFHLTEISRTKEKYQACKNLLESLGEDVSDLPYELTLGNKKLKGGFE